MSKTLEESKEQVADVKNTVKVGQDEDRQACAVELAITYGTNRGQLLENNGMTGSLF